MKGLHRTVARLAREALIVAASWFCVALPVSAVQISQVADRAPDLAVFVNGSGLPAPKSAPASAAAPVVSAALETTPLTIKSSMPWDASEGVALVVALDVSASLRPADFAATRRALGAAISQLPDKSRVALIAIGSEVRTMQSFGVPASVVGPPLDSLAPDASETALYEALLAAQQMAATAAPTLPLRRFVLVLTDGIDDSRHGFSADEVTKKLASGGVPVYALALTPTKPTPQQREAIRSLAQIARASGGDLLQTTAATSGSAISVLLAQAMKAQLLTLDCSQCARDGAVRNLQIGVRVRDVTSTDSREVRLPLAEAPKPPPPPKTTQPPKNETKAQTPVVPEAKHVGWFAGLGLPQWLLTLIAVAIVALVAFFAWRAMRQPKSEDRTGTTGIIEPESEPSFETKPPVRPANQSGQLVTLDVAGQGRIQVRIGPGDMVIGRGKGSDVAIDRDSEASSKHAAIALTKGALVLRDLGSANGTYLNGTKIVRPEPLSDRDLVLVGRTEVRIYFGSI